MSPIFGNIIFKILGNFQHHEKHSHARRLLSIFSRKSKIEETSPYIIVRANTKDYDQILKVMHESYYANEPTVASLKIPPNPFMDERALRAMAKGYTLVARCKHNGCIVGACINEAAHPWDPEIDEKLSCGIENENIKKLIMFYAYLMKAPDLWRCLGVGTVYEMAYLFVKRQHRKKGLAFRLMQESKTLGADSGFPVLRCDATSVHTAKICERLGMQKVAEIPYCSYLDHNLEPVFNPPWPHEGVQTFCDCAPQYNELKKKIQTRKSLFSLEKSKDKYT
ncbi:unnamed protein product [Ceutorhynchus assimilis]|uniref:aralkylamine N-acetyltransferase n=1 Tax=Ceutorhynchus assimilis TaxID=467358 RepID=A0A9N9QNM5_9CUCU|nr:unnamed protein product [Ceutorhynchus assimilis]